MILVHVAVYDDLHFPQVLNQVTPDPYDEGIKCETALQYRAKNRSTSFLPSEISPTLLHLNFTMISLHS